MSFNTAPGDDARIAPATPDEGRDESFMAALEQVFVDQGKTRVDNEGNSVEEPSEQEPPNQPAPEAGTPDPTSEPPSGADSDGSSTSSSSGGDEGTGGAADPLIPGVLYSQPPPTQEPTYEVGGRTLTQSEMEAVLSLSDYWSSVPAEQVQQIDQFLAGRAQLHPGFGIGAQPGSPAAGQPGDGGGAAHAGTVPGITDDEEWLDPRAAAEIQRLRQQVEAQGELQSRLLQHTVQSTAEQQRQLLINRTDAAAESYAALRQITPEEMQQLTNIVAQSGVFMPILQRHSGNVETAVQEAYDLMYWQVDSLRQRALDAQTIAYIERETEARRTRRKATSLTSGGGSAPRTQPTPQTRADREAAMVAEVRAAMAGGQAEQ